MNEIVIPFQKITFSYRRYHSYMIDRIRCIALVFLLKLNELNMLKLVAEAY